MKEILGFALFGLGLGIVIGAGIKDVWWAYLLGGILLYSGLDIFVSAKITDTKEKDS